MDEHNELRTRLRAVGMELFRRDGLRFTMQQAAAMMHISKKTIYAVYPSKEALLLDMVDDAFTRIHARKQRILDGPGTLAVKLRAVIIALPEEYTALDMPCASSVRSARKSSMEAEIIRCRTGRDTRRITPSPIACSSSAKVGSQPVSRCSRTRAATLGYFSSKRSICCRSSAVYSSGRAIMTARSFSARVPGPMGRYCTAGKPPSVSGRLCSGRTAFI